MCDILINSNMTNDIFELLEQDIITRGLYVHPYETTLDYLYTSYVKNKDKINFILSGNLTLNDNTFFTNDDNKEKLLLLYKKYCKIIIDPKPRIYIFKPKFQRISNANMIINDDIILLDKNVYPNWTDDPTAATNISTRFGKYKQYIVITDNYFENPYGFTATKTSNKPFPDKKAYYKFPFFFLLQLLNTINKTERHKYNGAYPIEQGHDSYISSNIFKIDSFGN